MVADLAKIEIKPAIKHLSNSAATLKNPAAHFDLVRAGISLYGLSPDVSTLGKSHERHEQIRQQSIYQCNFF